MCGFAIVLSIFFCRYVQTLRQAFDDQCRWPHLGNALKYLSSSVVIVYGLTHAEDDRTNWWRLAFGICVIYQMWWDVFVDWELLVVNGGGGGGMMINARNGMSGVSQEESSTFLDSATSSGRGGGGGGGGVSTSAPSSHSTTATTITSLEQRRRGGGEYCWSC